VPTPPARDAPPQAASLASDAFAYFTGQNGVEVRTFDAISAVPELHLLARMPEGAFSQMLESFMQAHSCSLASWKEEGGASSFTLVLKRGQESLTLKLARLDVTRRDSTRRTQSENASGRSEKASLPAPFRVQAEGDSRPAQKTGPVAGDALRETPAVPSRRADGVRVALILDDAGGGGSAQWEFLKLPAKLTFAVLPDLANSRRFAEEAVRAGHEVIVHLPMQPMANELPSHPGNILKPGMTREDIERVLDSALRSVPGARGMNNHQGSLATADRGLMRLFISSLKARGLFFVDSFTHASSLGMEEAGFAGMPPRRRDVFLDHVIEHASIERALAELIQKAATHGTAIGIGHVTHPETLRVLRKALPIYSANGVTFVCVSEIP
jgi:polysaccharide deacetylase 2 family uncharacterized protein YibQ